MRVEHRGMGKRVALLADGSNSDLYASFCAVKLARRMDAKLMSILLVVERHDGQNNSDVERWQACSPAEFLYLVSNLGNFEGIRLSYHLIDEADEDSLVEFLVASKITCIIMGTQDRKDFEEKQAWLSGLVQKIYGNRRWYLGDLTVFLARPWGEKDFRKVLNQISSDCSLYPIEMVSG